MKHWSTVSRNVRVLFASAALAVGALGCGSGGGDATGGAGSGGAGTGGAAPCTLTDVNKIFVNTTTPAHIGCTLTGACHDANGAAAGLNLLTAGWETHLVGRAPSPTAGATEALRSKCSGMDQVYLKAGSNPATGLLIDKLNPDVAIVDCGARMPNLGAPLTSAEFACVQSWATTLTTK